MEEKITGKYLVVFDFCSGCSKSLGLIFRRGRILTPEDLDLNFTDTYFKALLRGARPRLRLITKDDPLVKAILTKRQLEKSIGAMPLVEPKAVKIAENVTAISGEDNGEPEMYSPADEDPLSDLIEEVQSSTEYPGPHPEEEEKKGAFPIRQSEIQERIPLTGDNIDISSHNEPEESEEEVKSVRKLSTGAKKGPKAKKTSDSPKRKYTKKTAKK